MMSNPMTASERVHAAVAGKPVDRVPFCFWHHFQPEGSGQRLAEATIDFFVRQYNLDIVKIMPDLPYPMPDDPIREAEQMRFVRRLELDTPGFREQLICIRAIRDQLGPEYPLLLTLFSPFTYALNFMGKQTALAEVRSNPDPFEEGLGTIAANLRKLMEAAIDAGVSGIFFSCMGATTAELTQEEYENIARPYDLAALRGAQDGWLNTIHVHAEPGQLNDQVYFELFTEYPVSVISWSDRVTGPSLGEAHATTDKCLMGGLAERGPLTKGSETELENEIMGAITQTKGRRLILANGCSLPNDTSEVWLQTARRLVDNLH